MMKMLIFKKLLRKFSSTAKYMWVNKEEEEEEKQDKVKET